LEAPLKQAHLILKAFQVGNQSSCREFVPNTSHGAMYKPETDSRIFPFKIKDQGARRVPESKITKLVIQVLYLGLEQMQGGTKTVGRAGSDRSCDEFQIRNRGFGHVSHRV